ncbi:ferritin-like domain-containing protein [Phormidesmis sp. 146-12]
MNFFTQILHIVGSGATAYISARSMRDLQTRPDVLAAFQLAESGSVPFLEALRDRAQSEGNDWLAERLDRHAADERRHGQIFAHALKQLNKQVIDFKKMPQKVVDGRPDERKQSPFFGAYFEGYSQDDLKPANIPWTVFFGSTYILELDASQDFLRMANTLPEDEPRSANLKKGMISIAQDETSHAAYLREAMERYLGESVTQTTINEWRTRKVNAMMAMVSNFIQKAGKMPSMVQEGAPVEMERQEPEKVAA